MRREKREERREKREERRVKRRVFDIMKFPSFGGVRGGCGVTVSVMKKEGELNSPPSFYLFVIRRF